MTAHKIHSIQCEKLYKTQLLWNWNRLFWKSVSKTMYSMIYQFMTRELLLSIFLCFEYYSLLFIVIWFILAWLEKTIWISWLDFLLFGPNYEVSFHGIRILPVCIVFWLYFANSNQKKISLNYERNFEKIQENQFNAAAFYIKYLLKF